MGVLRADTVHGIYIVLLYSQTDSSAGLLVLKRIALQRHHLGYGTIEYSWIPSLLPFTRPPSLYLAPPWRREC